MCLGTDIDLMLRHTPSDISRTFWRRREDKTDSQTLSGHCRTFLSPSPSLFLLFFGSLLRTSVGQARLHSVSVSVSNVSLRQSWFDPDTDTATATQVQLQIQKTAIHRYFSGPRQLVWHVVCTDAFKIVSFSMEMLQIFHEKHLYCIHNSFVLFFSLSFSLSLFLTRSLSFSKQSSDHYSSLKVLIVHCTANPRASCNISINNKDFAPGTGIPFGPLIPTLSLGITVCPA